MKKISSLNNVLTIIINKKAMPVSEAQKVLAELDAEGERLAKAIASAKEVESPDIEQKQAMETLERLQRLNSESAAEYRGALDAAQFRRLVTINN